MFDWILNAPLDEKNVEMQKLCRQLSRGVFRTLSNICDWTFCENSQRRLAISYFCKISFIIDVCKVFNTPVQSIEEYLKN